MKDERNALVGERRSTRSSTRIARGTANKRVVQEEGHEDVTCRNELQEYAACEVSRTITKCMIFHIKI